MKIYNNTDGKWNQYPQGNGVIVSLLVEPSPAFLAKQAAIPQPKTPDELKADCDKAFNDKVEAILQNRGLI